METAVQLYSPDVTRCATALREPSICLIECGRGLGVLIAESSEDTSQGLLLDRVLYLRVKGKDYEYLELATALITRQDDLWVAQHRTTEKYLPEPSGVPYCLVYLAREDYRRLVACRTANRARPVFGFCQQRFGALPGFSYESDLLSTPAGYAEGGETFSGPFLVER